MRTESLYLFTLRQFVFSVIATAAVLILAKLVAGSSRELEDWFVYSITVFLLALPVGAVQMLMDYFIQQRISEPHRQLSMATYIGTGCYILYVVIMYVFEFPMALFDASVNTLHFLTALFMIPSNFIVGLYLTRKVAPHTPVLHDSDILDM